MQNDISLTVVLGFIRPSLGLSTSGKKRLKDEELVIYTVFLCSISILYFSFSVTGHRPVPYPVVPRPTLRPRRDPPDSGTTTVMGGGKVLVVTNSSEPLNPTESQRHPFLFFFTNNS